MQLSPLARFLSVSVLVSIVYGHGALVNVKGGNGVNGQGFGIDASTPRDGSRARPFQQDTSIIRDFEINSGRSSACGRTRLNGVNDIPSSLATAVQAGLPSTNAQGQVEMTLHQVNGDGAGPYRCDVNTDGTGANFQPVDVVTNVPGRRSRSRAKATDFPLVAQMPAGLQCTGGANGNACIVRCRNSALAGPFGGCVAVTMGGGAATGNGTNINANANDTANQQAAADAEAAEAAEEGDDSDAASNAGTPQAQTGGAAQGSTGNGGAAQGSAGKGGGFRDILKGFLGGRSLAADEDEDEDCTEDMRKRILSSRVVGRLD